MKNKIYLFLTIAVTFWSCEKPAESTPEKEIPPPAEQIIVSKNISTGTYTEVSNTTIAVSGSTVKIAKPNTPVDGIEIVFPSNGFSSSSALKVSYAEIKSHQLGANFNPISPILSVSCDGGYSNGLIALTIPVKVPSGHIPLGFFLDETTGKLEGIPIKNYTSTSITLLTRHFLAGSTLKSVDTNLKSVSGTGANIVISSIAESVLSGQPIIASGFKPGTDDWEFVNYGSYIAPGGHCAGQTMAAMWYYYEKKATEGNLFNKFSDNAKLWQDNAKGYKFCSVLQNDQDWNGSVQTFFDKYIDKNQEFDKQKFLTFAGAMLVTGEPQAVAIYKTTGELNTDGSPKYAGHALICYQVSVSGGKLYICDPNTPGTGQIIDFTNNQFKPYMAKLNGNDASKPYPFITYYAKTAVIEWNNIGKRWEEFLNNTIGTINPYAFPPYIVWVKDKTSDFELKDGMVVTKDTLNTYVECPTAQSYTIVNGKRIISAEVYAADGSIRSNQTVPKLSNWTLSGGLYVKLTPGLNKLGYAIIGWHTSALFNNSVIKIPLFIDFKWITVNYSPLSITPNPFEGVANKEYTFIARSKGTAPKTCKFTWDFGDGSGQYSIQNDSIVAHAYSKEGNYTISVKLYDSANKLISEATAPATIKTGIPAPEISMISMGKATIGNDSVLIAGDLLYLSGWNFGASKCNNCKVLFNGTEATKYLSWSNSGINVYVPFGATSGNVEVVVENQKSNGKAVLITDIWKYIKMCSIFKYRLANIRVNYKDSKGVNQSYNVYEKTPPDVKPVYSITGNNFTIEYKYQFINNNTVSNNRTCKIEGTFSTDGSSITNLKYDETDEIWPNKSYATTEKISFTITDLSLSYWLPTQSSLVIQYLPFNGTDNYLKSKLTNFKYSFQDVSWPENNIQTIISVDSSKSEFILQMGK